MAERKCNPETGFSLLETVVALVILAVALTTLFDAYGSGIRAVSAGNQHGRAQLLAQSVLAEVAEPATSTVRSGRDGDLNWRIVVKPASGDLAKASAMYPLYDVAVTVGWAPGRTIVLRSLRLGSRAKDTKK